MPELPSIDEKSAVAHGLIMAAHRGDGPGFEALLDPYLDTGLRTKSVVFTLAQFAHSLAEIAARQAGKSPDWFLQEMALHLAGMKGKGSS